MAFQEFFFAHLYIVVEYLFVLVIVVKLQGYLLLKIMSLVSRYVRKCYLTLLFPIILTITHDSPIISIICVYPLYVNPNREKGR